jgi:ribonuclease T1
MSTRTRRSSGPLAFALLALALALGLASCAAGGTTTIEPHATRSTQGIDAVSGLPWIQQSELPPEALRTLQEIDDGGPYDYPGKDDTTFTNAEGLLPDHESGYYREYTVETPGSPDRGARRIVTGDGGEFYYTDDHYRSFRRIAR